MQASRDNDGQDDRPPLLAPLGWVGWVGWRELNRGLVGRPSLCGHIRSVVIFDDKAADVTVNLP
jgi:hypothetical protein